MLASNSVIALRGARRDVILTGVVSVDLDTEWGVAFVTTLHPWVGRREHSLYPVVRVDTLRARAHTLEVVR